MRLHLTCPHCNQEMAVRSRHAGSCVACPHCAGVLTVPGASRRSALPPKPPRVIHLRVMAAASVAALVLVTGMIVGSVAWLNRHRPAASRPPHSEAIVRVAMSDPVKLSVPSPAPQVASPTGSVVSPEPAVTTAVAPRLSRYDDEDLRKQLTNVPELTLDKGSRRETSAEIQRIAAKPANLRNAHFTLSVIDDRPDLSGLPLRRGADCQLGKEHAEHLQALSRTVRTVMNDKQVATMTPEGVATTVAGNLRSYTNSEFPESVIPTMMQMLCVEQQSMRLMVVKQLATTTHRRASDALVKMALFDLSDKIRAEAVAALKKRPAHEYRDALLAGFRYPWAPVADHAAEALVALEERTAVPALKKLAEQPDPAAPYYDPDKQTYLVREVVRINHLRNCLMCHALSTSDRDLVRGRIPVPGEPLPPAVEYYEGRDGIFVRADITYLRQDFSVFQPVDNAEPWPNLQRFDYVVRARPATPAELSAHNQVKELPAPQREAARYALKALGEAR